MTAPAIEMRRTIHGGKDSALQVELSAVYRDGGGITAGASLDQADGFAVYLRNPLAMHVADFLTAYGAARWRDIAGDPGDVVAQESATLDQARTDAFSFADALGDHLGAPVVSVVPRPAPPAPPAPVYDSACLCEVAACLWEAVLELVRLNRKGATADAARAFVEADGYSAARLAVCALATECETAWRAVPEEERDALSFDWDFVPGWLSRRMGWESGE